MYLFVEIGEGTEDRAGVAALPVFSLPHDVSFESLPSHRPASGLHSDVVVAFEQFVLGKLVDVDDPFSCQDDVFQEGRFDWDHV